MPIGVYPRKYIPTEIRFWNKVKTGRHCWIWLGALNSKGYGTISVKGRRKTILSHRFSYEIHNGPISKNICVLHKCDNPKCVKPTHLFLGTQSDNIIDMVKKNRQKGAVGIRNANSKLNDKKVKRIRTLYNRGNISYQSIAYRFGVSKYLIGMVVRRTIWKHI